MKQPGADVEMMADGIGHGDEEQNPTVAWAIPRKYRLRRRRYTCVAHHPPRRATAIRNQLGVWAAANSARP